MYKIALTTRAQILNARQFVLFGVVVAVLPVFVVSYLSMLPFINKKIIFFGCKKMF